MKTLVDPQSNLYQYRCDGSLCNPDPRKFNPESDYTKMVVRAIYIREEEGKDYDSVQIQGWNYITTRTDILHICPDCTKEIINKLQNKIKEVIHESVSIDQASEEIANLIFYLDLYDV